ncbi:MAG: hypothetical protein QOH39_3007 [Verrucomicrobiota bacterium]|jgi:hypothetical protein
MKTRLFLTAILAALLLGRAAAWPTKLYGDGEVVGRAELIVVARVKEGSIKKIIAGRGSSYEHHAILVISRVVKGELHKEELPITISYGLLPVSARQEKHMTPDEDATKRSGPEEPGESTKIYEDNPSMGFGPRVSGDVYQEQIWLLHRLGPPRGDNPELSPAGAFGISNPEDLQPLKKEQQLSALLHTS